MKKYEAKDIRNVALVGHKGHGKTSLAEAFLFDAKATTRLGAVDAKTSTFDTEPEEIDRRMSIATAVGAIEWKKRKINLLDTPGDGNFHYDTRLSLSAADAALVVVSAPDGVGVVTERCWDRTVELGLPRLVFINKMERERADPDKALASIRSLLSSDAVPVQLPIGLEAAFKGVVDVLTGKAHVFEKDGSGKFTTGEVPADLADALKSAREALVEKVAESSDELLEKYLDKGVLSEEEIQAGFSRAVHKGALFPVFYGSATQNVGVQLVMDFLADHLPAPLDLPPVKGKTPTGEPAERKRAEDGPVSAFCFKTVDAQGGTLSIFRVLSGTLSPESQVINPANGTDERIGSMVQVMGKKTELTSAAPAGDIVGVLKLKSVITGHTLCDKKDPFTFEALPVPEPNIAFAIKAKSKSDEDKLGSSLTRMLTEDPTLRLSRHEDTKDYLLAGMGSPHIELAVARMKRRFGVEVTLELPRVAYRETITRKSQAQGRHKRQTGGRGQFGDCWLELAPRTRGEGFVFENRIKGGTIPGQFIPAVEKGVREAMVKGWMAGFPVVDFSCAVYDGSYHDVDSSEMAFKRAAIKGFKAAMDKAGSVLLEPVLELEIVVPEDNMGDIMGDLNSRRGRVMGMESINRRSIIKAQVPQAEVLSYSSDLDSRTGGRGSFSQRFSHYQEVPHQVAEKIVAQFKREDEEDED
ncbi:MAG TPA: elongation factor G [Myxococcota bacterium]|nr:elongation factor G [Myxococcota bacterium]HRY95266.1 elongation factor G [Myxococcota bacterium]HSA22431.1 elongation factor G [Myxococcota bacterium]